MEEAIDEGRVLVAPLDRLRLLAAGTGGLFVEREMSFPAAQVWSIASDFEGAMSGVLPDVQRLRVRSRRGGEVGLELSGRLAQGVRFDAVVGDNWWLMQSRLLIGGLAVAKDGRGSRVAFLGALRPVWLRRSAALARPLSRLLARRVLVRLERRCLEMAPPL